MSLGPALLLSEILAILVGCIIGARKGRLASGFVWSLFLTWIGVIVVACMRPSFDEQVRRERERQAVLRAASGKDG